MKRRIVILFVSLYTINTFSQEKENQISIAVGPSFAVGNFADKSLTSEESGSAGTGANFSIYYGHKFSKNFGLGIKWLGNSNKFNTNNAINELNALTGIRWSSPNSYWTAGGVLLGLTAHAPVSEKFIFDFIFLGGYAWLNSPEIAFSINNITAEVKIQSASASAFGYNIGAGFSYFFNPKWNLLFNIDYIGANFKFDKIVTNFSDGTTQTNLNVKQPWGVVNPTVGIGYNF
jgi:opacity protein-like surface antigen